jgi:hypothetical protein
MSLLPLFQWLGHTPVGIYMQQSTYAFAIVEMFHLLSLTVLGGAILIVDLRLLGVGLKSLPPARLAREFRPYLIGSLLVASISGILLLSEEPIKCYYSPAFRAKMLFLVLAVAFYLLIQGRLSQAESKPFFSKSIGAISLTLWLAVGLSGRAIGLI